jgi:hypothetical protein
MNMYETINSNVNSLAPDVVDALIRPAGDMLDVARVQEMRPEVAQQFSESSEYRLFRARCPHRRLESDNGVVLLKKADVVTKDGQVKCALCGATILTNWDAEDFKKRLLDARDVIDTILLYGIDYNLGNFPRNYSGDRGIIDKMIDTKAFISTDLIKIAETFCAIGKAENVQSENRRTINNVYRDNSMVTSYR